MATRNQECSVSCLHNRSTPSNQEGKIFSCILFCEIKFTPVGKTPIILEQPQDSLVAGTNEEVGFSTGNVSSSPPNIKGKVVPGIQTSEGAIINQVAQIDEKKTRILDLPPEVMHMIFDCLLNNKQERWIAELRSDWCTAVCLGLVSQSFYNILKRRHPTPLWLSCKEVPNIKPHKDLFNLASLLKNFMGPRYRMIYIENFGPLFLNRDIYGDCRASGSATCIGDGIITGGLRGGRCAKTKNIISRLMSIAMGRKACARRYTYYLVPLGWGNPGIKKQ
jgi:hypothetical protein